MPPAIAAAASALAPYVGGSLLAAKIIISVVIIAASQAYANSQKRSAEKKNRAAYNASLKDRELTVRSAISPARTIYGKDRVGGQLCFAHVTGAKKEFLHIVVAHASHACEGFDNLYLNETKLPIEGVDGFVRSGEFVKRTVANESILNQATGSGTVTLANVPNELPVITKYNVTTQEQEAVSFGWVPGSNLLTGLPSGDTVALTYTYAVERPLVRVKKYLGTQTVADPFLLAECGDKWKSTSVGAGQTYTAWRFEYDTEIFGPIGLPNISASIRGKKILDPRNGLTQYSDNSALIISDWLRSREGLSQDGGQVSDAEVIAAANICDEIVQINGAQNEVFRWDVNTLAEWTPANATGEIVGSYYRLTATASDPSMLINGVSFQGANRFIRARIKRIAGSSWDGGLYYSNASHGNVLPYRIQAPAPVFDAKGWALITWDMYGVGQDWQTLGGTAFYLGFGSNSDDVFDIAWLAVGGESTEKRYVFNGSFTSDEPPTKWIEDLSSSMSGACVYVQGKWLVRPGYYRSPSITINGDSLAGGVQITPKTPRANLANAVRATHRDEVANYVEVQAPVIENQQYADEDGGYIPPRDIQLPFVCGQFRAQRLAKIELERSRQAVTVSMQTNLSSYNIAPTDTVTLNFPEWFGAPKVFECIERTAGQGIEVDYIFRETTPANFEWNNGEATVGDPAPDTTLPRVVAPGLLVGFAAGPLDKVVGVQAKIAGVRVSWSAIQDINVTQGGFVEVEWRAGGDWIAAQTATGDAISTDISPAPRGVIAIRGRAVNALGQAGGWRLISYDVNSSLTISTTDIEPEAVTQHYRWSSSPRINAVWNGLPPTVLLGSFTPARPGRLQVILSGRASWTLGAAGLPAEMYVLIQQGAASGTQDGAQPVIDASGSTVVAEATMVVVAGQVVNVYAGLTAGSGTGNTAWAEKFVASATLYKL